MIEIYTPRFIELASHPKIQEMIEPRVGMIVILKQPVYRSVPYGLSIIISVYDDGFRCSEIGKANSLFEPFESIDILLPDLSWMVRKLREKGNVVLQSGVILWSCRVSWMTKDEYDHYSREYEDGDADTPELACMLALHKVMGIEEE